MEDARRSGHAYFIVWAHTPEGKNQVTQWREFHESVYTRFTAPPLLRELLTYGTRLHYVWFARKMNELSTRQLIILAYIRRVDQAINTAPQQAQLVLSMCYQCHHVILSETEKSNLRQVLTLEREDNDSMRALVGRLLSSMSTPFLPEPTTAASIAANETA